MSIMPMISKLDLFLFDVYLCNSSCKMFEKFFSMKLDAFSFLLFLLIRSNRIKFPVFIYSVCYLFWNEFVK